MGSRVQVVTSMTPMWTSASVSMEGSGGGEPMSLAIPFVVGGEPSPQPYRPGVVTVLDYGFAHCAATCSCGWAGPRRYLRGAAKLDAWQHSIRQKCDVSVPLVWPGAVA
ncbi:hypothetical protein [Mycolicibacterium sp. XJ1819]